MTSIHQTLSKNKPYQGILMAAWLFACLVIHLSLYPYTDWRDIGIGPFEFLWGPWIPIYQTVLWSDIFINVIGYIPLGFLFAAGLNQRGKAMDKLLAPAICIGLSFAMESIQTYLPSRVPSKMDLLTNSIGAIIGCLLAGQVLRRRHWVNSLNKRLEHWMIDKAWLGMGILLLWFLGIMAPQNPAFNTSLWLGNLIDPSTRMDNGTLFGLPGSLILWVEDVGPDLINYCFLMSAWMIGLSQTRSGGPRVRLLILLISLTLVFKLAETWVTTPIDAWFYQMDLWMEQNGLGLVAASLISLLLALPKISHRMLASIGIVHLVGGWALTLLLPDYYAPDIDIYGNGFMKIFFVIQEAGRMVSQVWPIAALAVLAFIALSRPNFQR